MWLTQYNRILTKDNLASKGWTGTQQCVFCNDSESISHLFLNCPLTQQIWFWLGQSQEYMHQWASFDDIIQFAVQLPTTQRYSFLIVFSALCWTV